jgi:hypothetical protein
MTGSKKGPATRRQLQAIEEMTLRVGEEFHPRAYTGMEASLEIRRLNAQIGALIDDGTLPPPTFAEAANAYVPETWELTREEKQAGRAKAQEAWDRAIGTGADAQ